VAFHVKGVLIRIEVGVFDGVGPVAVAEDILGDFNICHASQMGGGGVAEQPCMKLFFDAKAVSGIPEDVLQGALGNPFPPSGREQGVLLSVQQIQVMLDNFK
jgi:hypothetical protein